MLNDVIIDKLSDRLVKRLDAGNKYVLEEIGKKLKKIKTLTPEEAEKLSNVLKYGGDYDKIVKKLAKITNINKKDIYKIFDEVAKKDYKFAKQFYDYRKIKFIPYDKNTELKSLVRAIANRTADEYLNIAGSNNLGLAVINPKTNKPVFKVLKDAYNQIIDEAILNVVTGRETFDTMLKKTYNELDKGLQVIYKYKDKNNKTKYYKKNVISAVRQNMTDGLSSLQQEMQKEIGEQFKSDGVQITVVYNPAPDHAEVQGRQFSTIKPSENELSEFEKFQNDEDCHSYDGKFFPAEFEGRDRRSIGQYNCRHLIYSIILGVNKPRYSDEKLQQIIDRNNKGFELDGKHYTNYEGSQLQRRLENEIRKNKLEQISAKARGDMDNVDIAQRKISALNKKYKEVCNAGGFTPRDDLLSVSGYKRINVKRATNTPIKPSVDVNVGKVDSYDFSKYKEFIDKIDIDTLDGKYELNNNFDTKGFINEYNKFYKSLDEKDIEKVMNDYEIWKKRDEASTQPIGQYLNKQLKYDGFPELIDEKEFWVDEDGEPVNHDAVFLDSNHWFRGVASSKDVNGEEIIDYEKTKQFVDDFKHGDYYAGIGMNGNGTYATSSFSYAESYARFTDEGMIYIIPKNNAKIVDVDKIFYLKYQILNKIDKSELYKKGSLYDKFSEIILGDNGYIASLLGYDIIDLGTHKTHKVILNRSSIKVVK